MFSSLAFIRTVASLISKNVLECGSHRVLFTGVDIDLCPEECLDANSVYFNDG